jgi:hypothetical protein
MKAAPLRGDLLTRKGAAAPVPTDETSRPHPAARPRLTAVDRAPAGERPGSQDPELKRDKFGRVRLSVRLDPHRHLSLKLLSAHHRMSLQETLIAALDAYLGDEVGSVKSGRCDCLRQPAEAPRAGKPRRTAGVENGG